MWQLYSGDLGEVKPCAPEACARRQPCLRLLPKDREAEAEVWHCAGNVPSRLGTVLTGPVHFQPEPGLSYEADALGPDELDWHSIWARVLAKQTVERPPATSLLLNSRYSCYVV